ncbi:DUF1569 domain-containing protein [Tautonia sociabilis]|uniref:DUF1569 domain-containing protein n=1 Tax=Tautonia sociabilis TaxID=2080755 RepID=A0A432MJU7_9BACT|nr:DUF1569 domain-containing protein [Tautonia sociabilis]RUL87671.1 DUF1569 domain-containing protein [Tautonia sociabilis]
MERRSLDFRDADSVIAEIRRLQSGGYTMLGKWNLAQICDHLTATMRVALDGRERRLPWPIRALVFGPLFRQVIRTRRMRAGLPTLKPLVPTSPSGPDDPASIDACIATLERARNCSSADLQHPAVDLTLQQWQQLSWIHAAHHLGFLIPGDSEATTPPAGLGAVGQPS